MVDQPIDPLLTLYEQSVQSGVPADIASAVEALLGSPVLLSELLLRQMFEQVVRLKQHQLVVDVGHRLILTQSQNTNVLINSSQSALELRKYSLAYMYLQQGLSQVVIDSERGMFHSSLFRTCKDNAQMDDALFHAQQAYLYTPTADTASNLIMALQYNSKASLKDFYAQAAEYSQLFSGVRRQHDPDRLDPEKAKTGLRIGFVSGDFITHSLSALLVDIVNQFRSLSPHEIYLYHTRPESMSDPMTTVYQKASTVFRFVEKLSVDQLTQQIVDDQIDVLVELAGHTAGNRMQVFLRKPAPVQVGWVCGMMSPCALETVPYFLADSNMVTPDIRAMCPEQLIELPCSYGYNPLIDLPANPQLPYEKAGVLTFGCMNNPCKLHPQVFDVWARILHAVPNSQLRLKVNSTDSAHHLGQQFSRRGIPMTRLGWIMPTPSNHDVMRFYASGIDIALDPWPCAGMLTTLEAWWMGCPTITLAGDTFLHRQSTSVFTHLDLPELIAHTADEYVTKAVALATNLDRLRELRRTTRPRLEATIIRRPDDLARGVLKGLEQAWAHWCTTRAPLQALRAGAAA